MKNGSELRVSRLVSLTLGMHPLPAPRFEDAQGGLTVATRGIFKIVGKLWAGIPREFDLGQDVTWAENK